MKYNNQPSSPSPCFLALTRTTISSSTYILLSTSLHHNLPPSSSSCTFIGVDHRSKMGIKNNNNNHHYHHHHQISSFNPALCLRPFHPPTAQPILIKDIINTLPSSNTKTLTPSDDHIHTLMVVSPYPPSKRSGRDNRNKTRDREVQLFLSPRIGCMGQIKRSSSCKSSSSKKKLFQFQRMFSNMSMKSSRGSARVEDDCFNRSSHHCDDDISIADTMDLPLPVVKALPRRDAEVCSLWRRRRGGDGLRLPVTEHLHDSFWRSEDHCRLAA